MGSGLSYDEGTLSNSRRRQVGLVERALETRAAGWLKAGHVREDMSGECRAVDR